MLLGLCGGMAGLLMMMMLLLLSGEGVAGDGAGYDLALLLPLSGREADRGRALLAGVRAALPPGTNHTLPVTLLTLPAEGGGSITVRIHYTDTQCDRMSEDAALSRHLAGSDRPLVVVGGMCPRTLQNPDGDTLQQSLYFRQNVPQVTFTESFAPSSHLVVSPVTIRPSVRSAYRPLVSWLRTMACRHVVLLSSSRQAAVQMETQVLKEELMDSKFTISLQVKSSNPNVPFLLRETQGRVVLLQADVQPGLTQLCHLVNQTATTPGRYLWVLLVRDVVTSSVMSLRPCHGVKDYTVVIFSVQSFGVNSQEYDAFQERLRLQGTEVIDAMTPEAAVAFDTMTLTLGTLSTLHKVVPRMSRQQFTDRFIRDLTRGSEGHVTGGVWFDENGNRDAVVNLHILNEDGIYASNGTIGGLLPLEYSQVDRQVSLQGVHLAVFVVMTSLAFLGVTYAVLILIFNLFKRNDKMIKMTSPNINTVILMGAIMGYVSMVTLGLDSSRVSLTSMAKLVQASTFLLAVGYSLVFGSLFAKAWRVFFIFKNLNANGKNTRDEHLLFGVCLLVVADLIVLIPWAAADPITCTHTYSSAVYQPTPPTDVIIQSDACASSLQVMWVLVLYVLKGGVLVVGMYFTYQSRHVSLPTLKDAREVYEVVYTLGVVGVLCLPVLLSPALAYSVKYTVGALAIFTVVTATLTLGFIPKIYLLWRRADKASPDSIRFLFSESLRRTQRSLASCSWCCHQGEGGEDKYAQEVLGSEIETLKRTIKEKDTTIRELTDRLYFGTEKKLHEYISSPRRLQLSNVLGANASHQRMRSPSQEPGCEGTAHPDGQHPVEVAMTSAGSNNVLDTSSPSESSEAAYRSYCRRSRRSERHRRRSPHGMVPPGGRRTHYDLEEGEEVERDGMDMGVHCDGSVYGEDGHMAHTGVVLQSPDDHYQQQHQQQQYHNHQQHQQHQYHHHHQQQQQQQQQQQEHRSLPPGTPRMYPGDSGPPEGHTMTPYNGPPEGHTMTPYNGPAEGHTMTPYNGPPEGHTMTPYNGPPEGHTMTPYNGPPEGHTMTPYNGPPEGHTMTPYNGPPEGHTMTPYNGPPEGHTMTPYTGPPEGHTMTPYTPHIIHPLTHHTPDSQHVSKYSTPSPNHDSAIDNNSPSSAGSDQEMLQQHLQYTPVGSGATGSGDNSVSWRQGGLDLDAIEQEVTHVGGYHYNANPKGVSSYFENGVAVSQI